MASTIFGMSSFTYLVIGVIYAFANLDRHYAMQNENSEKDDKFFYGFYYVFFGYSSSLLILETINNTRNKQS